jgi:hypothetical protein
METFNGVIPGECLNLHWFETPDEARAIIEISPEKEQQRRRMRTNGKNGNRPCRVCAWQAALRQDKWSAYPLSCKEQGFSIGGPIGFIGALLRQNEMPHWSPLGHLSSHFSFLMDLRLSLYAHADISPRGLFMPPESPSHRDPPFRR